MTTDDHTPLDPTRIGEIVMRLPALCRTFGWDHPQGALDYVAPNDPETQLVLDILAVCDIKYPARRTEAWRRLDAYIEDSEALDRIAAAMV